MLRDLLRVKWVSCKYITCDSNKYMNTTVYLEYQDPFTNPLPFHRISVRLGEHDISSKVDCEKGVCAPQAIRVGVEEVIPHHSYDDRAPDRHNDIALIRMNRDVLYTESIRPVCLPSVVSGASVSPQPGSTLTVAGWGRTLQGEIYIQCLLSYHSTIWF